MSYPSSHCYETVYILRAGLSDSDAATIQQKIESVVQKFEGKLQGFDDWGQREMAYAINDEKQGRYCVVHYTGKAGVVEEIERHFKILNDVVRFLSIQVPTNYDYSNLKKQMSALEEEQKRFKESKERKFTRN